MHTFGEVLGTDLRSLGSQPALVLVNLRKILGRHNHWTHDEEVTGGERLREIGATGPGVTKKGFSLPWGCSQG